MERRRGPIVDGVSRLLSILAIVLGIGTSLFLYKENQILRDQVAKLDSSTDADTIVADAKKFNEAWNSQLNEALVAFNNEAQSALDQASTDLKAANDNFKAATDQLGVDGEAIQKTVANVRDLQSFVYAPKLRLAQTTLRIQNGGDRNFAMVNNEGRVAAGIQSVSFMPKPDGQFRASVSETQAMIDRADDGQSLLLQFTNNDNQSKAKDDGYHLKYERAFEAGNAPAIPGQSTVPVAIMILNHEHRGWGWEGALEVTYADGKSLVIPSIRALFISDQSDAT